MTRDACDAQKFVQNVGPTIVWRSRRILDWTLIGGILNLRVGRDEEGRYRILSCAARDYGKSGKKIVTIYIYQRSTYHVITVFTTAVNSRR